MKANLRELLVAMTTDADRTKPCIALIYRLLRVQRFCRVLFGVDRSALSEIRDNSHRVSNRWLSDIKRQHAFQISGGYQ